MMKHVEKTETQQQKTAVCRHEPVDLLRQLFVRTAPVQRKVKPAEMLQVKYRYAVCPAQGGESFCVYQKELLRALHLETVVLRRSRQAALILFFDRKLLEASLKRSGVETILRDHGYPVGAGLDALLAHLQARFREQESIPHEVGVFLGYPVKDVVGFINREAPTATGAWKVYGEPAESMRLMRRHRAAERSAVRIFARQEQKEGSVQGWIPALVKGMKKNG